MLQGDELVAVLVGRDDEIHGDNWGKWFLEAGSGPLPSCMHLFVDPNEAKFWLREQLFR